MTGAARPRRPARGTFRIPLRRLHAGIHPDPTATTAVRTSDRQLEDRLHRLYLNGSLADLPDLAVTRAAAEGAYDVVSGKRRYYALRRLAQAGKIPADTPITCTVIAGTRPDAPPDPTGRSSSDP